MGGGPFPVDAVEPEQSGFPVWITFVAVFIALVLFCTTTVPAMRERRDLKQIEIEKAELKNRLDEARRAQALRLNALHWDPQTLLIEIDRLGLTPSELDQMDQRSQQVRAASSAAGN